MAVPLRDIHVPPAPPLWPPAPGWWVVCGLLLAAAAAAWAWRAHRRRTQRRIEALFDDAVATAATPALAIGAMSELLRRAARRVDPRADHLSGADWLDWLGERAPAVAQALAPGAREGRLLLEGGFRQDVDEADARAAAQVARAAWLALMAPGRRR